MSHHVKQNQRRPAALPWTANAIEKTYARSAGFHQTTCNPFASRFRADVTDRVLTHRDRRNNDARAAYAEFDSAKPLKLRGTVTKVELINPHSWFHIDVKGNDGKVTSWMIEGGSPNALIRLGYTQQSLPIGTEIIVDAFQAKDGSNKACGVD